MSGSELEVLFATLLCLVLCLRKDLIVDIFWGEVLEDPGEATYASYTLSFSLDFGAFFLAVCLEVEEFLSLDAMIEEFKLFSSRSPCWLLIILDLDFKLEFFLLRGETWGFSVYFSFTADIFERERLKSSPWTWTFGRLSLCCKVLFLEKTLCLISSLFGVTDRPYASCLCWRAYTL